MMTEQDGLNCTNTVDKTTAQTIDGTKTFVGGAGAGLGPMIKIGTGPNGPVELHEYDTETYGRTLHVRDSIYSRFRMGVGTPPVLRMPNTANVTIDGSTLSAVSNGADKVGQQNTVTFKGGFTGEAGFGASNPGWVWGANDFIITGSVSGDMAGINDVCGRLTEVHVNAPGAALSTVRALMVEAHLEASAVGGSITSLYGIHILAPHNGGTIGTAYGLCIESPVLATANFALKTNGTAPISFGGDVSLPTRTLDTTTGVVKSQTVTIGPPGTAGQGRLTIEGTSAGSFLLTLKAFAGQTVNLFQIQNSASDVKTRFDKAGTFVTKVIAAPADADIATSEVAFWFDNTAGAAKVKFKGKDSGGTVRTGEVALA